MSAPTYIEWRDALPEEQRSTATYAAYSLSLSDAEVQERRAKTVAEQAARDQRQAEAKEKQRLSARAMLSEARQRLENTPDAPPPTWTCAICEDKGYTFNAHREATTCVCRRRAALEQSMRRAGLPDRYRDASLANYDLKVSMAAVVGHAAATRFVQEWPLTDLRGLLFTGSVGTGKTHLMVGILRALVLEKGATGRFVDFGTLLKQLRASYSDSTETLDESEILRPVLKCNVLVLDEIGAQKLSDWVSDVIEHILNTRYNDNLSTLITTNLPFRAPRGAQPPGIAVQRNTPLSMEETLGDRVGMRMFSRLQEMCEVVEMNGADYRARAQKRRSA